MRCRPRGPREAKNSPEGGAALPWDTGGGGCCRGTLSSGVARAAPQVSLTSAPNPLLIPASRTPAGLSNTQLCTGIPPGPTSLPPSLPMPHRASLNPGCHLLCALTVCMQMAPSLAGSTCALSSCPLSPGPSPGLLRHGGSLLTGLWLPSLWPSTAAWRSPCWMDPEDAGEMQPLPRSWGRSWVQGVLSLATEKVG